VDLQRSFFHFFLLVLEYVMQAVFEPRKLVVPVIQFREDSFAFVSVCSFRFKHSKYLLSLQSRNPAVHRNVTNREPREPASNSFKLADSELC
jgi:hypothetical protein